MTERVALSIKQPWAGLIMDGRKTIENRTWSTKYRGRLYIHASKRPDLAAALWLKRNGIFQDDDRIPASGGIIGHCDLVDVVEASTDPWFQGPFGFVLANPVRLAFMAMPGKLSLFRF